MKFNNIVNANKLQEKAYYMHRDLVRDLKRWPTHEQILINKYIKTSYLTNGKNKLKQFLKPNNMHVYKTE